MFSKRKFNERLKLSPTVNMPKEPGLQYKDKLMKGFPIELEVYITYSTVPTVPLSMRNMVGLVIRRGKDKESKRLKNSSNYKLILFSFRGNG